MEHDNKGRTAGLRPPGFREVAAKSGVSITTVERVLNERGSVTPSTRLKVLKAAESLGLRRVLPQPDLGNLRIEVILPVNQTPFWAKLSTAFRDLGRLLPRGMTLHRTFVPENRADAMAAAIERSSLKRAALIIASETGGNIDLSLDKVIRRGEIVVAVSTGSPSVQLHAFSGIDNLAAGRTAASLINFAFRQESTRVLLLQATANMQSHRDRVHGFRQRLNEMHDLMQVVTQEEPGDYHRHVAQVLSSGWIPGAIYETGDSGEEIVNLLTTLPRKPVWVSHEHNDPHDMLLRSGILDFVLDQDPQQQAEWALDEVLSRLDISRSRAGPVRKPELRLFCADNLPD